MLDFDEYLAYIFTHDSYAHQYDAAQEPHRHHYRGPARYCLMRKVSRQHVHGHTYVYKEQYQSHHEYDAYRL